MANMILAGLPNIMQGGFGYNADTDASTICDQEPSSTKQAASNLPSVSTFLAHSRAINEQIDVVAIVNHNLDRKSGPLSYDSSYWRVVTGAFLPDSTAMLADVTYHEELFPTSTISVAFASGNHTNVDDSPFLSSSGADSIDTAGDPDISVAHLGFNTPSDPISQCSILDGNGNDHAFVVRAESGNMKVELFDDGVLIRELAAAATCGGADPYGRAILIFPFSTGELTSANGANVSIKITGFVSIYSVMWSVGVYPDAVGYPQPTHDSGWIPVYQNAVDWPTFQPASPYTKGYELQPADLYTLPAPVGVSSAGQSPFVAVSMLNQAGDDRLNRLGVLCAGSKWQPIEGKNFQALSFGILDASKKVTTFGGQDLPSARNRRRVASFTLPRVTPYEMAQLVERIDVKKGNVGAFLISLYPGDDALGRIMTFWATLDENAPTQWVHTATSVQDSEDTEHMFRFDRIFNVKEKI